MKRTSFIYRWIIQPNLPPGTNHQSTLTIGNVIEAICWSLLKWFVKGVVILTIIGWFGSLGHVIATNFGWLYAGSVVDKMVSASDSAISMISHAYLGVLPYAPIGIGVIGSFILSLVLMYFVLKFVVQIVKQAGKFFLGSWVQQVKARCNQLFNYKIDLK